MITNANEKDDKITGFAESKLITSGRGQQAVAHDETCQVCQKTWYFLIHWLLSGPVTQKVPTSQKTMHSR